MVHEADYGCPLWESHFRSLIMLGFCAAILCSLFSCNGRSIMILTFSFDSFTRFSSQNSRGWIHVVVTVDTETLVVRRYLYPLNSHGTARSRFPSPRHIQPPPNSRAASSASSSPLAHSSTREPTSTRGSSVPTSTERVSRRSRRSTSCFH